LNIITSFFFFNDTATTELYTLSLHDALPISFHEPEWWVHVDERLHPRPDAPAAEDVVLELVHHLVTQHVLQLLVGAGEWQHHPVLEELGDAAQALTGGIDDVRLLEIGLRRVQDDRLASLEFVVQHTRQAGVPPRSEERRVGKEYRFLLRT